MDVSSIIIGFIFGLIAYCGWYLFRKFPSQKWYIVSVALVVCAVSFWSVSSLSANHNPENEFLNLVLVGEYGSPMTMRCLIESQSGYAGYCNSPVLPGKITISKKRGMYHIDWRLGGYDYAFSMLPNGTKIGGDNGMANLILTLSAPPS